MPWRIVKQPNGKFARFDDYTKKFTNWNFSEGAAVKVCLDCSRMQRDQAQTMVKAAMKASTEFQFDMCVERLASQQEVSKILKECGKEEMPLFWRVI